ncbi:glycerol-3-phosphate 1-O-acyltransferase PlsY [Pseudalkalibacillus salsuginis]|uniref:glycerol-3-phosphate 1-O-acyltransferase PlsY n=1 Tax=Pseudalkalibacillus salsuginis TaxID=2910972 RepID=UPI001F398CB7|nr:glycerol-3-phosphate 1-O-acyltransferase PlsY [Pseudalkalibacillus salsuginis]MCF6408242.1 glycerol-3-phosphate 1-O-acyltransferase PlsY [Pseudalkalibacillus salsuginis]
MELVSIIVVSLIGYLIGSISFSYLIAKKIKQIDIRTQGSGNAGATNTLRLLGWGPAITVLLLDASKGIVAVLLSYLVGVEGWIAFIAGFFAIIGHNWPIYYGFRGGKGVATTIGVFAILVFIPTLISGIVAILIIAITRYVSLGSLIFMFLTPVLTMIFGTYNTNYIILATMIGFLSLWRHRQNIQRLIKGTESKLGQKKEVTS